MKGHNNEYANLFQLVDSRKNTKDDKDAGTCQNGNQYYIDIIPADVE
jgi:hypothetical protein